MLRRRRMARHQSTDLLTDLFRRADLVDWPVIILRVLRHSPRRPSGRSENHGDAASGLDGCQPSRPVIDRPRQHDPDPAPGMRGQRVEKSVDRTVAKGVGRVVPEPQTMAVFAMGLLLFVWRALRKSK
jgi:hypothetical protein